MAKSWDANTIVKASTAPPYKGTKIMSKTSENSPEEMRALIASLQAQNAELTAASTTQERKLTWKVAGKGGLSVYGLGRFPITLYREQWDKLLDQDVVEQLRTFILANASFFKKKG